MSNTLKLAIDIGHNVPYDRVAQGIKSEDQLNFEVGTRLMKKCSGAGIQVIDCTPANAKSLFDSLNKISRLLYLIIKKKTKNLNSLRRKKNGKKDVRRGNTEIC